MNQKDNQKDDLWDLWARVLDVQCQVFVAAAKAVPLALPALDKQKGLSPYDKQNTAGLLKVGIRTLARNQLTFLEGIASVVQKRGIYWIVRTDNQFYISRNQFEQETYTGNGGPLGREDITGGPPQKQRTIYNANNTETLPGQVVRSEGGAAVGDASVNEAYDDGSATSGSGAEARTRFLAPSQAYIISFFRLARH